VPRLIVTEAARTGLERCRIFLSSRNPAAARKASQVIAEAFKMLMDNPELGRRIDDSEVLRELLIGFGATGYVALYTYNAKTDTVLILAFRHQREAGY
jgi:plasmid stabilization system protein ParE